MTSHPDLFAALAAPFAKDQTKHRQGQGRDVYYITAVTAMNRLDDVLGPENWSEHTAPTEDASGTYLCTLTIRLPDGATATRTGVGAAGSSGSTANPAKTAASDAFKRAAVRFGVGRYLYRDGVPRFVTDAMEGGKPALPPKAPERPAAAPAPPPPARPAAERTHVNTPAPKAHDGPPTSGKALFARCKDYEQQNNHVGLVRYVNDWGKLQGFGSRMVDWSADQVAEAYQEAARKIREYQRSDELTEALTN